MNKLSLLFHTIRYLKPVQIYGRFFFRFFKPRLTQPDRIEIRSRLRKKLYFLDKKQCFFPPNRFEFLNQSVRVKQNCSWNDSKIEKLWLYNLHYFDDLNAENADQRESDHIGLINRWINENPPGEGIGWEPYPMSLRTVNWIKWTLKGHSLSVDQLSSLYQQVDWLSKKLEYHLQGNHLIANAKALIFGGLFFEGEKADLWLTKGLDVMISQVNEQVLDDGGHFERSPMYHSIILEDILDIIQMAGVYGKKISKKVREDWCDIARKMLSALEIMCHPDGDIAFFNDSALKVAPKLSELMSYTHLLDIAYKGDKKDEVHLLPKTGYISIQKNKIFLLVDAAPVGPDYLPAHAHADSLSFELSIGLQRVFVNGGTSCYGISKERLRQRKTPAHNTLSINGQDSSEVWGGFRMARRAMISHFNVKDDSGKISIEASHDGFSRFKTIGLHHRKWHFFENILEIKDRVEGSGEHLICIYFHCHPLIGISMEKEHIFLLNPAQEKIGEIQIESGLDFDIRDDTYHPEFGKSLSSKSVVISAIAKLPFECSTKVLF